MKQTYYEETIRWLKKLTHTARVRQRSEDFEDAFDVFENKIIGILLTVLVLVSAAMLETLLLPLVFVKNLWEERRRKR